MLLASVLLTACSSSPGEDIATPGSVATVQAAPKGREIFTSNCAACHGAAGEGQPDWHVSKDDGAAGEGQPDWHVSKDDGTLPPPPLNGDGHTWHHSDGLLYRVVSQGGKIFEDPSIPSFKSAMPAFGDRLSHQEIIEVLTYVKSLWGDKTKRGLSIRESQTLASEQDPFPSDGR
jgi:mono/diheme cytochrome c family protein